MVETSADADHLLEVCRRIEFTLASLYRFLSNLYGDIPEIAAVFLKTANEEENHALQFVLALKLPNMIEHPTVPVGAEDYLLREVLDLDAKTRRTLPPPIDALRAAVDLEKRLAAYHVESRIERALSPHASPRRLWSPFCTRAPGSPRHRRQPPWPSRAWE